MHTLYLLYTYLEQWSLQMLVRDKLVAGFVFCFFLGSLAYNGPRWLRTAQLAAQ